MEALINHLSPKIFSYAELEARGISQRAIREKIAHEHLFRLRRGIYIEGSSWKALKPWEKNVAKILALHHKFPHVLFSHTSAALLHGLAISGDFPLHIYYFGNSHAPMQGVVKHVPTSARIPQVLLPSGIRVTSPMQTVLDCSRVLAPAEALAVADSAIYLGKTSQESLQGALTQLKGPNSKTGRLIAPLTSALSESAGESHTRFMLQVMKICFREQVEISVDGKLYRVDFLLHGLPIVVEFDGRIKLTDFGATDRVLERERFREKAIQNAGWLVFRVSWDDVVHQRETTMYRLKQLIAFAKSRNIRPPT